MLSKNTIDLLREKGIKRIIKAHDEIFATANHGKFGEHGAAFADGFLVKGKTLIPVDAIFVTSPYAIIDLERPQITIKQNSQDEEE